MTRFRTGGADVEVPGGPHRVRPAFPSSRPSNHRQPAPPPASRPGDCEDPAVNFTVRRGTPHWTADQCGPRTRTRFRTAGYPAVGPKSRTRSAGPEPALRVHPAPVMRPVRGVPAVDPAVWTVVTSGGPEIAVRYCGPAAEIRSARAVGYTPSAGRCGSVTSSDALRPTDPDRSMSDRFPPTGTAGPHPAVERVTPHWTRDRCGFGPQSYIGPELETRSPVKPAMHPALSRELGEGNSHAHFHGRRPATRPAREFAVPNRVREGLRRIGIRPNMPDTPRRPANIDPRQGVWACHGRGNPANVVG